MKELRLISEARETLQNKREAVWLRNDIRSDIVRFLADFDQDKPIGYYNYSDEVFGYTGEEYKLYCSRSEISENGDYDVTVGFRMSDFCRTLIISVGRPTLIIERELLIEAGQSLPLSDASDATLDDLKKFQEVVNQMHRVPAII